MAPESEIQITKTGEEPGATSLRVEVPLARVQAAEDAAVRRYAKRAKLPGFRPGRAPVAVVRRHFRDAIRESVLRELIGESWRVALDREKLKPIADPRVRDLKFADNAPVTFELLVEVKPEIELPRLGRFVLPRRVQRVSDEAVDAQLEALRRQKAPWVPVDGERPAAGDLVSVGIATLEAGPEGAWGEPRQYQLQLGAGQAIPDLEEQIRGLTPGETAESTVQFPDDFPDESKRGQRRTVRITLHEVKRQQLAPLSDELARELGDFDSVSELRTAVREDLEAEARREADADVRRALLDQLIAANHVQAPRPLVQRALSAFARAYDVPDAQLERFAAEFAPIAERQVQRDLILDAVAERFDLRATPEHLDRRIAEIAQRRGTDPGQLRASLEKAGRLDELKRNLTEEKVFSYLLAQSTVKEE